VNPIFLRNQALGRIIFSNNSGRAPLLLKMRLNLIVNSRAWLDDAQALALHRWGDDRSATRCVARMNPPAQPAAPQIDSQCQRAQWIGILSEARRGPKHIAMRAAVVDSPC
jgi:hypothetical protein